MKRFFASVIFIKIFTGIFAVITLAGCKKNVEPQPYSAELQYVYSNIACASPQKEDYFAYCQKLEEAFARYTKSYIDKAKPFFVQHLPSNLPKFVFYPFGGSDLVSALAVFPDADEFVTVSLESAGDARRFTVLTKSTIAQHIDEMQKMVVSHLSTHNSSNDNVIAADKNPLSGQISMSVIGARLYGYRPVSLRFFEFDEQGKIRYIDQKRLQELEDQKAAKLKPYWVDNDFSVAFRNMEIVYEKNTQQTESSSQRTSKIIHRHIAENLSNGVYQDSGLKKYLAQKTNMVAMTKAASYLLWMDSFSVLRQHLLDHVQVMVSDSTGILPHHFLLANFIGQTFGRFSAAFLPNDGGTLADEMRRYFNSQPLRPLDFHFGHGDTKGQNHLIILRKKTAAKL